MNTEIYEILLVEHKELSALCLRLMDAVQSLKNNSSYTAIQKDKYGIFAALEELQDSNKLNN